MSEEEEYFARLEQEKKARLAAELAERRAQEELEARKALHYLKCGKCGADMDTRPFRGVEVEICPECGAVLLDPGELEELAGEDRSGVIRMLGELFNPRARGKD